MDQNGGNERVMTDVWDWQTRVLHWVNALLVIALALLILGVEGMEKIGIEKALRRPVKELHSYLGHVFAVTLFLRIIWGFAGNRYARWPDMLPFGKEGRKAIGRNIRWYLSGFRGGAARVAGHDPLASLFYIALFIVLISQAVTGILLSGADFHTFPGTIFTGGMSEAAVEKLEHSLEEVHEFGLPFILFFLAAHITGLVVHEVKEKTGLLSSMVHGKKYFKKED